MAAKKVQVLCVHGVGRHIPGSGWDANWRDAIRRSILRWNPKAQCEFSAFEYDPLFEGASAKLNPVTYAAALASLTGSLIWHGVGDLFRGPPGARGAARGDLSGRLRWTAGMVAQWASDSKLRGALRTRIAGAMKDFFDATSEHVVVAHSLGSLVTYDAFRREPALLRGGRYVTLGSQIGHPAVRSIFGGRIEPLESVRSWHHLYNRHDDVLTAALDVRAPNFTQVDTEFDAKNIADHDAVMYLAHEGAVDTSWREAALGLSGARVLTDFRRSLRAAPRGARAQRAAVKPRALLVGINEYPDPASRLEGCVNDVFRVSEVLQESGFPAEQIRVVLDDRATSAGVLERLRWLLDGAEDGAPRVFYYSGHGAQIPSYDEHETVDSQDECLVTYDFDWSRERAITDKQFCEIYSQLPYTANFIALLDCCHSGGMTRDAGARVRGLAPPDDIRHRALRWEPSVGMWVPRELRLGAEARSLFRSGERPGRMREFLGEQRSVRRLGRGTPLWTEQRRFKTLKRELRHKGPYMPVIVQACGEQQFAYEYRHGVTSFGAFTFCLTEMLRDARRRNSRVTFDTLVRDVAGRLADLKYDQAPTVAGPRIKTEAALPISIK